MHKHFKAFKQVFYLRKESKTTTMFILIIIIIDFSSVVSFLIELYMPLGSVSLIQESCIYGLGFNSQTLNGSLQLLQVMR